MTFDTIENNSSKQYIQIGYEEAFKDALSKEDIVTINGSATVLTVTNLNGQNLNNFTGQASRLDSPLERFKVTPTVDVVDNKVNITENSFGERKLTFRNGNGCKRRPNGVGQHVAQRRQQPDETYGRIAQR